MAQTDNPSDHGYISAFLRDAVRIKASNWIVTNVMRIWHEHRVPASAIRAALDEVLAEHPIDPEQITSYREAVDDMLSGLSIPLQRTAEPETHNVTVYCGACDDMLLLDDDDDVLVARLASFTTEHADCPSFAVKTHQRVS